MRCATFLAGLAGLLALTACTADGSEPADIPTPHRAHVALGTVRPTTAGASPAGPSLGPPAWVRSVPRCFGRVPTLVGTPGPDVVQATRHADVIWLGRGDDVVTDVGRTDRVCVGQGDDVVWTRAGGKVAGVSLGAGDDVFRGDRADVRTGTGHDQLLPAPRRRTHRDR